MTKTRELLQRAKLLFGESITMKLVVGLLLDQDAVGVAMWNWSVAGLGMQILVYRSWFTDAITVFLCWNLSGKCLLLGDAGISTAGFATIWLSASS